MSKRLHLTKTEQRQVDAAAAVFAPWGLAWTVENGGRHKAIAVTGPKGGTWRMTILCTPKDADHAVNAARQRARQVVNEINRRLGL
mgnify:CR=1 FL=1